MPQQPRHATAGDEVTGQPLDPLPLFPEQVTDGQDLWLNPPSESIGHSVTATTKDHSPPSNSTAFGHDLMHDPDDFLCGNGQQRLDSSIHGMFQGLNFNTPWQPPFPRRRSRYRLQKQGPNTIPCMIPASEPPPDPLQRWQDSPPEEEAAPIAAIIQALGNPENQVSHFDDDTRESPRTTAHARKPGSTAGSNTNSLPSGSSHSSSRSNLSTRSRDSNRRNTRLRDHRRGRVGKPRAEKPRIFACTFCCDSFRSKYDWARHEKSLHLNLETWNCAPVQGYVLSPTGEQQCAYCGFSNPTSQHLEEHNHHACSGTSRVFSRKDHLVQHLRFLHRLKEIPCLDTWRRERLPFTCRCGFCNQRLNSWKARVDHLAGHFRKGCTMRDWQGEHEFPPSIAAQVQNGIPPYLIGDESRSQQPFSASDSRTLDHYEQIATHTRGLNSTSMEALGTSADAPELAPAENGARDRSPPRTFSDILARHLAQFARSSMEHGVMPTEAMFQLESRRVIYDCEDAWNQTIADNPSWLASFRRQLLEDIRPGEPES